MKKQIGWLWMTLGQKIVRIISMEGEWSVRGNVISSALYGIKGKHFFDNFKLPGEFNESPDDYQNISRDKMYVILLPQLR